jgi:hypothetical protein
MSMKTDGPEYSDEEIEKMRNAIRLDDHLRHIPEPRPSDEMVKEWIVYKSYDVFNNKIRIRVDDGEVSVHHSFPAEQHGKYAKELEFAMREMELHRGPRPKVIKQVTL